MTSLAPAAPPPPVPVAPRGDHAATPRVRAPRWRRWLLAAALGLALLVVAGALIVRAAAPSIARRALLDAARRGCPRCELEVGALDFSLARGRAWATNVRFASDPREPVRVELRAARVELALRPTSLLGRGPAQIESVALERPRVAITQDLDPRAIPRPVPPPRRSPLLALPPARVGAVRVRGGELVFTDHIREPSGAVTVAAVRFDALEGGASAFATRAGLAPRELVAELAGRIAGSGHGRVALRLAPLATDPDLHVELALRDQDLAGFGTYAAPAEGLALRGRVDAADATLHVVGDELRGEIRGVYRELDARFAPTERRGRIDASLANLACTLELVETNAHLPPAARARPIARTRHRTEPLMGFLWAGVLESCVGLTRHGQRPLPE